MTKKSIYKVFICLLPLLSSCVCSKKTTEPVPLKKTVIKGAVAANAPAIVYKTKKDYAQYVPVGMNEDKTKIVSYPDPSDVYYLGKLSYPTPLENGYLLDNRGIGPNVAFLNYTYQAYSQLKEPLSMEEMMRNLLDKYPLLEMWTCGPRAGYKDELNDLNRLIQSGFPNCQKQVSSPTFILHP